MDINFDMYPHFSDCPIWWQHFIDSNFDGFQGSRTERYNIMHAILAEYNCSATIDNYENIRLLSFDSDEDFVIFKLRWV